jgi:diketogulonate reductase-like aldo/keto reductase
VGTPSEAEYDVIDTLAQVAEEAGAGSAAVALAWLRTRPAVTSILVGPRKLDHLEDNLAGLEVTLTPAQLAALDQASAPTLNYPAELNGRVGRMLMYAGATVDGEKTEVYPPLLNGERY